MEMAGSYYCDYGMHNALIVFCIQSLEVLDFRELAIWMAQPLSTVYLIITKGDLSLHVRDNRTSSQEPNRNN